MMVWLLDWLLGRKKWDVAELARRLDAAPEALRAIKLEYTAFLIPKRGGGQREILAPNPELKKLQRTILRRLLARLRVHPVAKGFEKGESIVTHARIHTGKRVVVQMDVKDFFLSTSVKRIERYFRKIGWNREAAALLTRICTCEGGLPQGAPTSPRLSNLVNYRMDAQLTGLARFFDAVYSRYADDLTFSFDAEHPPARMTRQEWFERRPGPGNKGRNVNKLVYSAQRLVAKYGYEIHKHKKLRIRRRHQQQRVTGLVVNEKVTLPRTVRRWLRAVEHHEATGREMTLTPEQLQGWRAYRQMIETQRSMGEQPYDSSGRV